MLDRLRKSRFSYPLWVDSLDYCQSKLLHGAPIPWLQPGELGDFYFKMDGLFSSDCLLFDLGRAYFDLASLNATIRSAMGSKERSSHRLKVLLGDGSLRSQVLIALNATAAVAAATKATLVVSFPSPARWLTQASVFTLGSDFPPDVVPREIEAGAIYLADNLRGLSGLDIGAIVIDQGEYEQGTYDLLEANRPILNLASHYSWPVILRAQNKACWSFGSVVGVSASLGCCEPTIAEVGPWGIVSTLGIATSVASKLGSPAMVVIPLEGEPNEVMRAMAALSSL